MATVVTSSKSLRVTGLLENRSGGGIPSCPCTFCPQHETLPLSLTAQEKPAPADTSTASLRPRTSRGVLEKDNSLPCPLPNSPFELVPQHEIFPPSRRAHVCQSPEATSTASSMSNTFSGTPESNSFPASPVPSSPRQLSPQQEISPVACTAQVCSPPAATATASETLITSTGTAESNSSPIWPLPSCPSWSEPQQDTFPPSRRAQVCHWPADTSTASLMFTTLTGTDEKSLNSPSPNSPLVSSPQQEISPVACTAQVCSKPAVIATASVIP